MGLESSSARAEQMARQLLLFDRLIDTAEIVERIDAVTAEAVRELAAKLVSGSPPSVAVVGAGRKGEAFARRAGRAHGAWRERLGVMRAEQAREGRADGIPEIDTRHRCRRRGARPARCCLRHPAMGDYAAWAELRALSRQHLTVWEPQWARDELARSAFRRRLRQYQREMREDQGYAFLIFREADATLLGGLSISNVRRGVAQAASVGYWIGAAPRAPRPHDATRVEAMLPFAFDTLGLHRLEAACLPHNAASARVLEKAGLPARGHGAPLPQDQRRLAGPRSLRPAARRCAAREGSGGMMATAPGTGRRLRGRGARARAPHVRWPLLLVAALLVLAGPPRSPSRRSTIDNDARPHRDHRRSARPTTGAATPCSSRPRRRRRHHAAHVRAGRRRPAPTRPGSCSRCTNATDKPIERWLTADRYSTRRLRRGVARPRRAAHRAR